MRADLATLLAVLVAMTPRLARADDPIVVPAVPEPSCQCGPNGEWIPCSRCSRGEGADSSSSAEPRPQGVPPIVKLAAVVVGGAVVVGMFAVAPGHMAALFATSKSARQARDAWQDEREGDLRLERAYTGAVVLGRDLDRTVASAARPLSARLGAGYEPPDPATSPPPPWSPSGACSQVVAANQQLLDTMDRRATAEARAQFPTWASLTSQAKQQALGGLARATGLEKLLKQGKVFAADYKRGKEMEAFLKELEACEASKANDPTNACERVISDRVNAELKVFMNELQAGAGDAQERVREASSFYQRYVADLGRAIEKQSLWAARCSR